MQNSELLDFTGGMNTVVAPHLLPPNEALEFTNIDTRFGSLKSVTDLHDSSSAQGNFFTEYKQKLYYYEDWRSNTLIDDKLYWADGVNTGKIMPNGDKLPLGISTPQDSLTQTPSGIVGDGVHKGDFKYTYTFYSSTTGIESAPARLPGYVQLDEQNVTLSDFESLPPQADKYRVYRVGGYLARFTLVDTIIPNDLPYTDSIDDTLIDGRLLQTLRTGTPPVSIHNFVELNGRLFGSQGNKVFFSGLGSPDSWYSDDFFNMPDTVTALAKVPAGLLVMGRQYTYLLFGAAPTSFRTKVVSDHLGCINNRSVAYYNDSVIFLGVDGIFASDGYSIQNLTYRKIRQISDMNVSSSTVVNDVYYLTFKPFVIPSDELYPSDDLFPGGVRGVGADGSKQGLVTLDFKRGNNFSYGYLDYSDTVSVGRYRGEIYIVEAVDREYIGCLQTFPCAEVFCLGNNRLSRLAGHVSDKYKEVVYLSPQLIDGSYSTLKEYDKVRINFIGKFEVVILFSNLEVAVVETIESPKIITNELELLAEQDSVAIIGIPNSSNKSYSIQFAIKGIGIIKSIQYSWQNRELP